MRDAELLEDIRTCTVSRLPPSLHTIHCHNIERDSQGLQMHNHFAYVDIESSQFIVQQVVIAHAHYHSPFWFLSMQQMEH